MMSDPTRLFEDPSIADALRADLERAQAKAVTVAGLDLTAGAAGLRASIAAETTAGAGAGAGKGLAIGLAGVLTAGALAWFALGDVDTVPAVALAGAAPIVSGVEPVPPTTEVPQVTPEPAPAPAPEPAAAVVDEPVAAPTPRKRQRKSDPSEDYLREAKLISQARAALKTDASGALALLREARSEFPRGLLREEREALTILSLAKLGRSSQAQASAKRFLEKHGEGPYAELVRRVLD